MPAVQMADGSVVQMPDKASPDQLAKLRRMKSTPSGRRMSGGPSALHDYPSLPFTDRTVIAALDKPEEKKAFLEKKYGQGSVSQDKRGLIVTAGDKKMRVDTGLLAEITAQAPELALGTAGAIAGAPAGPIGAIAGAGAGGMAGKAIKEAVKSATGLQRESPKEIVESVGTAGAATAAGEGLGKGIGLLRKLPGRSLMLGTTPETKAMTDKLLKAGARPPPTSTTPDARKLQRVVILAQKLSGTNKNIDRANFGYLQDRAGDILNRAGVTGAAKDETMARLTQTESTMSFQDTGRLIQNNADMMLKHLKQLNKGKIPNTKEAAYLAQVAAKGRTPEQAFAWLTEKGETDRLDRFIKTMGNGSVVVEAVRQRALRQLLSGSLVRTEQGEAKGALEAELNLFTEKQQKLLFPGGLDKNLRTLAKETQFLYPQIKDPAMAGFTAGTIMQKTWYARFYAQGMYAMMRAFIQKPAVMRRIAIGLDGSQPSRKAAKIALKNMFYFGAIEMNNQGKDPSDDPRLKDK